MPIERALALSALQTRFVIDSSDGQNMDTHAVSVASGTFSEQAVHVMQADYRNPVHGKALVGLLDAYARDPAGGGLPLSEYARTHLVEALARRSQAFSVLAFHGEQAVGLVNCLEGFSTFACRPLINVHDVAVLSGFRGHRVGERMMLLVEKIARERGACKLTLEVLEGNAPAARLYQRMGFADYQLDPGMGHARFLQKWLE